MIEENYKRRRFNNDIPAWFFVAVLCNYNFKSFKKFIIYLLHFSRVIDLRYKKSKDISNEEIIIFFEPIFSDRIPKSLIRKLTNLKSGNTFNDKFGSYLYEHNLIGRRSFTLSETYGILNYWQGEGNWGRLNGAKKKMLADVLKNGNYERTALEFRGAIGVDGYQGNLISPKKIKALIKHIDLTEDEGITEELIGYEEFQNKILWMFSILMIAHYLENSKKPDNK